MRLHAQAQSEPRPYTSRHRLSNACTILSATLGSTAWLAIRCSGFENSNARSIVSSVGPRDVSDASSEVSLGSRGFVGAEGDSDGGVDGWGERVDAGENDPGVSALIASSAYEGTRCRTPRCDCERRVVGYASDRVFPLTSSHEALEQRRFLDSLGSHRLERPPRHLGGIRLFQPTKADLQLRFDIERLFSGLPICLDSPPAPPRGRARGRA